MSKQFLSHPMPLQVSTDTNTHTHTHTHPFNSPLSATTRVTQYQKGETNLDFTEARDSEWQWHQLGHMQVCTLLQTDNHTSTPPLSFLQAGCPSCRPTNSIKALKAGKVRNVEICRMSHTHTHTHNRSTAVCPGLPRWAGKRRNTHPLTPVTKQKNGSHRRVSTISYNIRDKRRGCIQCGVQLLEFHPRHTAQPTTGISPCYTISHGIADCKQKCYLTNDSQCTTPCSKLIIIIVIIIITRLFRFSDEDPDL